MFSKSTLIHLRLPFSFFLMPVYCFALSISTSRDWFNIIITFLVWHIFVYPASNAYNSYFDKDEGSIGGVKNPPKVSKELYNIALLFDLIGILLSLLVSFWFALGILLYGLVSKAYSHPLFRLKKFPIISWLTIGIFQGFFTFIITIQAINQLSFQDAFLDESIVLAALLSSLMLLGSYPMTQIYQHEEDAKRGDLTLSRLLGIKGTFLFTFFVFGGAGLGYLLYFKIYFHLNYGLLFLFSLSPVVLFFTFWFYKVLKNSKKADFEHTMRLNLISAISMNAFFITFWLGYLG